jgi:hypothetical protein
MLVAAWGQRVLQRMVSEYETHAQEDLSQRCAFRPRNSSCRRPRLRRAIRQRGRCWCEAAETHHVVFAITDGTDADWATWSGDWLVNLSRLPELPPSLCACEL